MTKDGLRLVLDTNLFVAASFNGRSHSARILGRVRQGDWTMVWNEATRHETKAVLDQIPPVSFRPFRKLFRDEDEFTGDTHAEDYRQIGDPDDRKFAALAAAAEAVLVSNDDDLLSVRDDLNITVLTPSEMWDRYG
jgi:predicted nucleic acid-binding protein